ncbi:MAG: hypothetical protein Q8936_23380 [Bacillota bacterium]|nr:hypothetical protein [Bacillota bacterium]
MIRMNDILGFNQSMAIEKPYNLNAESLLLYKWIVENNKHYDFNNKYYEVHENIAFCEYSFLSITLELPILFNEASQDDDIYKLKNILRGKLNKLVYCIDDTQNPDKVLIGIIIAPYIELTYK